MEGVPKRVRVVLEGPKPPSRHRVVDFGVRLRHSPAQYPLAGGYLPRYGPGRLAFHPGKERQMELPSVDLVALNPQPIPPGVQIKLVALNPQPLPPKATIDFVALNPQPLPPNATLDFVSVAAWPADSTTRD
jgi:hypothetical protein